MELVNAFVWVLCKEIGLQAWRLHVWVVVCCKCYSNCICVYHCLGERCRHPSCLLRNEAKLFYHMDLSGLFPERVWWWSSCHWNRAAQDRAEWHHCPILGFILQQITQSFSFSFLNHCKYIYVNTSNSHYMSNCKIRNGLIENVCILISSEINTQGIRAKDWRTTWVRRYFMWRSPKRKKKEHLNQNNKEWALKYWFFPRAVWNQDVSCSQTVMITKSGNVKLHQEDKECLFGVNVPTNIWNKDTNDPSRWSIWYDVLFIIVWIFVTYYSFELGKKWNLIVFSYI